MNDQKPDIGLPHDQPQAERRLARGLEDVSSLFLSRASGESAASKDVAAEPALATLLRPCLSVNRDRLISLLENHMAVIEEGLRAIDTSIPCHPHGSIDLLAVDGSSHLAAIDVDTSADDALLLRAVCHFDWLVRNVPILRRMFRGHVIDFSSDPRLFLVAPDFSPSLRCAAGWIARPRIICLRYCATMLQNGVGVMVEPA